MLSQNLKAFTLGLPCKALGHMIRSALAHTSAHYKMSIAALRAEVRKANTAYRNGEPIMSDNAAKPAAGAAAQ